MQLIRKIGTRIEKTGQKSRRSYGLFYCEYCNREVEKRLCDGKKIKSCGCRIDRHGHASFEKTHIYQCWEDIKKRCMNQKNKGFHNYGGRGINVCEEWKNSFSNFASWALSHGYAEDLEIDRKDNNGNYEPGNCHFVTHVANSQNRRNNKLNWRTVCEIREKYKSGKYVQRELSEMFSVNQPTISKVILQQLWKETF